MHLLGYMLPSGKDFVGTPWEMQVVNDLILRRKNGYIYGYSSSMILVPEIKLGKLQINVIVVVILRMKGRVQYNRAQQRREGRQGTLS